MSQRWAVPVTDDPFSVLGLPRQAGLSDDDVRAAWRRIATATHPDRDDGGDPARFGAAAAAYDTLRTAYGRGEALAVAGERAGSGTHGRLGRLAVRTAAAAAASGAAVAVAGLSPASIGVLAGALTWLVATGLDDMPPRVRD